MHKVRTLIRQSVQQLTHAPWWQRWHLNHILLAIIVIGWMTVSLRIATPKTYVLPLPDQTATMTVPFVHTVDGPFRWVTAGERILPTVITSLSANIRQSLAFHFFPHTEYVINTTMMTAPASKEPIVATISWQQQTRTIPQLHILPQSSRTFMFIAPRESADDISIQVNNRDTSPVDATGQVGVAITRFTSTPIVTSPFISLLVVGIQAAFTIGLMYTFLRVACGTPVSRRITAAYGLCLTSIVSIYELASGLPQSNIVWWVLAISTIGMLLLRIVDVHRTYSLPTILIALPVVVVGAIVWYVPYATNGCLRTTIPPREWCSLTYLDYWVRPIATIRQLPELSFPSVSGIKYSDITPLPTNIHLWISAVVFMATSILVKAIRGWDRILPQSMTATIAGAALITTQLPGMFPNILWMNVLDPTAYGTWGTWFAGVSRMRIPVSPLSLAVEGWLIHSVFGFGMYKWVFFRMMLISLVVLTLLHRAHARSNWWHAGIGLCLITSYSIYYSTMFAERYIAYLVFSYDILLVFALVTLVYVLRRSHIRAWHVVIAGCLLAIADNTRPYMMVFTPILVVCVSWYLIKRIPKRWLALLFVPLIPILIWHINHVAVLHQPTWSNHTGYNLCNAWPCPTDVTLMPEQPAISANRDVNLNTALHTHNSNRLTNALITYNQQDLVRVLERGIKLIIYSASMPSPHATSISQSRYPDLITAAVEWHAWSADVWLDTVLAEVLWPPHPLPLMTLIGNALMRLIFFGAFMAQGVCLVVLIRHVWRRFSSRSPKPTARLIVWHGIYALMLLGMYFVSSISEFGENYRWVSMMGMAALYLPYPHLRLFFKMPRT